MRNLFILNGSMPMLVADSLMRTALAGQENVLIVENTDLDTFGPGTPLLEKKYGVSGADLRRAEDLIARTLPAQKGLTCHHRTTYPHFLRHPLAYLREARQTVRTAVSLRVQLASSFDRMFYSGNARLQYALADCAARHIRLEHGLGDYMYASTGRSWNTRLRRKAVSLATGYREFDPDEIYLADSGRCRSVGPQVQGLTRVPGPDIAGQFARVMAVMATEEPRLVDVLEGLRIRAAQYRDVVIYMPLNLFPIEDYGRLLDAQLAKIDPADTLFVLKPHPTDAADYKGLFAVRGLSAMWIEHPVGRCLPAEFIAALLPQAKLMGVGSSALFYGKWWMDRTIIYAGVGMEERVPVYRAIRAAFAADIAAFG